MGYQTATNPQTGEKAVLIDNEWKPYTQSATNDKGMKAFLIGDQWITDQGVAAPAVSNEEAIFGKSTSKAEPSRSLIDKARGAIEAGAALASGRCRSGRG